MILMPHGPESALLKAVKYRAFPAFPQYRGQVLTATDALGSSNAGRGADLAIFLWHLDVILASVDLARMIMARLTPAQVVAAAADQWEFA